MARLNHFQVEECKYTCVIFVLSVAWEICTNGNYFLDELSKIIRLILKLLKY